MHYNWLIFRLQWGVLSPVFLSGMLLILMSTTKVHVEAVCTHGDVALNGTAPSEGRVEVCLNGRWGTVCDDGWSDNNARVVCRQVGFPNERAQALSEAPFGQGSGDILLDDVVCLGNESGLVNCSYSTSPDPFCTHRDDAGVRCNPCSDGDLRLIGGVVLEEGRVEVCFDRVWGTVCDDNWTTMESQVVCRQLGYSDEGSIPVPSAGFGQGRGGIFLNDVFCTGNESRLIDCNVRRTGINCGHFEDAGVRCQSAVLPIFNETCFNPSDSSCVSPSNSSVFNTCHYTCRALHILNVPCTHCDDFVNYLESNPGTVCNDFEGEGVELCIENCFSNYNIPFLLLPLSPEFCSAAVSEVCSQNCTTTPSSHNCNVSCLTAPFSNDVARVCTTNPCTGMTAMPPPILCTPYNNLNCDGNDLYTCLELCRNQTSSPILTECDGAQMLLDFCNSSTCLLDNEAFSTDLDCVVDVDQCLDLCRGGQTEADSTSQSCPALSIFCSQQFPCDIPEYPDLNCERNETLCLELCRNESFQIVNVTQNCFMLSRFCNRRYCDVNGYSELDCSGVDNAACLRLCPPSVGVQTSPPDQENMAAYGAFRRCEAITIFCYNNYCEALAQEFLPVSVLECDDSPLHFDVCLRICRNITVKRVYRRCNGQREVDTLCMEFTQLLLRGSSLELFDLAVDVADVFVSDSESALNSSIDIIDSVVSALVSNTSESAVLFGSNNNVDSVVRLVDTLLDDEDTKKWQKLRVNDFDNADAVLNQLETIAGLVGNSFINGSRNGSYMFSSSNTIMFVDKPDGRSRNDSRDFYNFPKRTLNDSGFNSFTKHMIPLSFLCDMKDCSGVVSTTVVRNLPSYLDQRAQHTSQSSNTFLLSLQIQNSNFVGDLSAASKDDIVLQFKPLETNESVVDFSSHKCVFWDFKISNWSSDGIVTSIMDENEIRCNLSHLTSFAVLVSPTGAVGTGAERVALSVVSYIGCIISILCLIPTIFILVAFRRRLNKGVLLYVHLNLSIALLIALVIFVCGVEGAASIEGLCIIIAALLHYFFLCVFCWMLAEGIMLYLLVVKVFGTAADKWYYLMFLGWGLPIPVVVVSAGVLRSNYIANNYCWLKGDPTQAALWTFIAPMALIILVNTVILIMTVFSIVRGKKRGGAETDVKNKQLVVAGIKGTVILLPLLGVTWVIGLFAVNNNTTVFAWIFTIANSLQGMFILILHVLRNEVVLRKIRLLLRCRLHKRDTSTSYLSSPNGTLGKMLEGTTATQDVFLQDTLKREDEESDLPAGMKSKNDDSISRKISQSTITSDTVLIDNYDAH